MKRLLPLCSALAVALAGTSAGLRPGQALAQGRPAPARTPQAGGPVVIPHPATRPGLSYLALAARPGTSARAGTIELLNPTSRTLRLRLAPVNGVTLSTLGSSYSPGGSRRHGATRWLHLNRRSVALAPHAHASVEAIVRVPHVASPGDYLSGVAVEAAHAPGSTAVSRGVAAVSAVRYAIGVEVSVPGRRRRLIRFSGAAVRRDPAGISFLLNARNLGNAILQRVRGHVRIEHEGRTLLSRAIAPGTFVSHTSIAYPVPVPGLHPSEGARYEISAWLRYGPKTAWLHTTVTFGHRAAAIQQRYGGGARGGGSGWWKDALLAAVVLYMAFTTALLLRRRAGAGAGTAHLGG